nr:protein FAR1-RELATED SEQUENCE 5-like [Ipomoea trifida]
MLLSAYHSIFQSNTTGVRQPQPLPISYGCPPMSRTSPSCHFIKFTTPEDGSQKTKCNTRGGCVAVPSHDGALGHGSDSATADPYYWTPIVEATVRPTIGLRFKTLSEGVEFYLSYGRAGDFDVRHSTMKRDRDGEVNMRYLVCSRQGAKGGGSSGPPIIPGDGGHVKQRRRRTSNRVECLAKVSEKAGGELAKDEVFRKKLNRIVWSDRIAVDEL